MRTVLAFCLALVALGAPSQATRVELLEGGLVIEATQTGPSSALLVVESNAAPLDLTAAGGCWLTTTQAIACGAGTYGTAGILISAGAHCHTGAPEYETNCFIYDGYGHVDQRAHTRDRVFAQCLAVGNWQDMRYRCNELYVTSSEGETCVVRNHWGDDNPYLQSQRIACLTP